MLFGLQNGCDELGTAVLFLFVDELLLTFDRLNTTVRSPSPPTSLRKYGQL